MNNGSPLVSCKNDLIDFLKNRKELKHVDLREGYINIKTDLPLKKPLITISRGKMKTQNLGFQDYWSDGFDEVENQFIETKGKLLKIYYSLHIWNSTLPKSGGEKEIERIIERIKSIVEFESNALEEKGITFFEFDEGNVGEDPDSKELFHSRCEIVLHCLWTKEFKYDVIDEIFSYGEIR